MSAAILSLIQKEKTSKGREFLSRAEPGRPKRRLPGGYIDDLAALKKAILLSPDEARKFNATENGYATPRHNDPNFSLCNGYSDASGEWLSGTGILFLPKE